MKLFHGSNMKVEVIDLAKSRPAKDFGRAFYLSAEEQQAKEMAQFKVEAFGGDVVVNCFEFDDSTLDGLKFLCFEEYSEEWAKFVLANRKSSDTLHDYDVVYGPIANDKIGRQIFNLQAGYIDFQHLLDVFSIQRVLLFSGLFVLNVPLNFFVFYESDR